MAASTFDDSLTWQKVGQKSRKSADAEPPTQPPIKCPECGSSRIWKNGFRYARSETGGEIAIQRFICRDCGRRFSEDTALGSWMGSNPIREKDTRPSKPYLHPNRHFFNLSSGSSTCQVGVTKTEGTKNLSRQRTRRKRAAGATELSTADIKGKLVEYSWHLKKEGYADSTVKVRTRILERLIRKGVDVTDPEAVKHFLASQEWSNQYRQNIVNCYQTFLDMIGLTWQPPRYQVVEKLPFIPLEEEIDALISGCGKKVATSLQLMKETAMRIGETWNLERTDIDEKRKTIRCKPEKGSKPRMLKVSNKLIAMLKALPRHDQLVFGGTCLSGHRSNFSHQRRRLAEKLQNPRLLKISFHTLRHWKATMEYHKTKDILHVKQMLGHRNINSTLTYTQLVDFENPEQYSCKVAKDLKADQELIEAGFEYVTERDGLKIYRKRK